MGMSQKQYSFHPAVARWFERHFEAPTPPQAEGWPAIQEGCDTLIAAPTGSGKTLAAFLASLDRLFREAEEHGLDDRTRILYVSPLKALGNDIHRNLTTPLAEIAAEMGFETSPVRAAVRSGDTSASERRKMLRRPPHILVTTPESLFLLLTSDSGRDLLASVDTLILDEIHVLAANRRGAHLALSVERLAHLTGGVQRIGLSATQRPMSLVAKLLVGAGGLDSSAETGEEAPRCRIVDHGHLRPLDLDVILPESPLTAQMENEVWEEVYDQVAELIRNHHTTLVFVNTRRMAERMTYHLSHRLGDAVAAHHGSLALDLRRRSEVALKSGELKALVATASMELGIDVGHVDLVCQIGSPRSIAVFLQRIGRSGHFLGGVPKGRLFPQSRDELIECAALLHAVRTGALETLSVRDEPLDVLSQQIVAAVACEDWALDDLWRLFRRAYVYRNLAKETFVEVVRMLGEGVDTQRGRRAAHLYYDGVNDRLRARKGARLTALTNAGAIPDNADYQVLLEPDGVFVGSVNEDFAIESLAGDVFRLGANSWRIVKIDRGTLRVEDAQGLPPNIPFWFGEAPGRTPALSQVVATLRQTVAQHLDQDPVAWLTDELGLPESGARQIAQYVAAAHKALGALPAWDHVILERFFDESGGMQLVLHSPFGSRVNRAWGLALRKRFCRSYNFELQAAATEDAIVLSLSTSHSFPLDEVFDYLKSASVETILVQALLDAPMFQTRWRWTATRALALARQRGGRRVPPQIQRMEADDLLASVFPDQQACLENISGDREVPDHPLVRQTIDDCLHEAMALDDLTTILKQLENGEIQRTALDLPEPSPLAHEALTAGPYAFLDDAPLEERRTQAVYLRRSLDPETIRDRGLLDQTAVARVREEAWPEARDAEEFHEMVVMLGCLPIDQVSPQPAWIKDLMQAGRLTKAGVGRQSWWVAAERINPWAALHSQTIMEPAIQAPSHLAEDLWDLIGAAIDLARGYVDARGPFTLSDLQRWLGCSIETAKIVIAALEGEGVILRGRFDASCDEDQWCHRRLLARIHRMTLQDLRARTEPVSAQVLMRFLFHWQHLYAEHHLRGPEGLAAVLSQLQGFEAAAGDWEEDLLPARMHHYSRMDLDQLCYQGQIAWARARPPRIHSDENVRGAGPLRTTPLIFFPRSDLDLWLDPPSEPVLSSHGRTVYDFLEEKGASFYDEIQRGCGLLPSHVDEGLGELTAKGLAGCDAFAGLRSLLSPPKHSGGMRRRGLMGGPMRTGRWSLWRFITDTDAYEQLETKAMVYLQRYGVVFRKLLANEILSPPWRDLVDIYRRMEATGQVRGGRFVAGFSGEQFALPEALPALRKARDWSETELINLAASDPLNLAGVITPGRKVSRVRGNRLLYRDGVVVAICEKGEVEVLVDESPAARADLARALQLKDKPLILN